MMEEKKTQDKDIFEGLEKTCLKYLAERGISVGSDVYCIVRSRSKETCRLRSAVISRVSPLGIPCSYGEEEDIPNITVKFTDDIDKWDAGTGRMFFLEEIGSLVFTSREEAEKAFHEKYTDDGLRKDEGEDLEEPEV